MKKELIKTIIKRTLLSIGITLILICTVLRPYFKAGDRLTLSIAPNIKVHASSDEYTRFGINNIIINNNEIIDFAGLELNSNWIYNDSYLLYEGNDSKDEIVIDLHKKNTIQINFSKVSSNGQVRIQVGNDSNIIDMKENPTEDDLIWNYQIPTRFSIFNNISLCLELLAMVVTAVILLTIIKINLERRSMILYTTLVAIGVIVILLQYHAYSSYEVARSHYFQLLFVMFLIWLLAVSDVVDKLKRHVKEYNVKFYRWATLINYLIAPIIAFLILEIISSTSIRGFSFRILFNNLIWYYLLFALLYLTIKNAKISCTLSCLIFYIIGLVNYFVLTFRGSPILPADIYALNTAISVSGSYTYNISTRITCVTMIMLMYIIFICKLDNIKKKHTIKRNIRYGIIIVGIFGTITYTFFGTNYINSLALSLNQWNPAETYREYGFALSYVANAKMLKVEKPYGYSKENINLLCEEISNSFDEDSMVTSAIDDNIKPNIIAIMNESFSDLNVISEIPTNEDCMPFIHSLTKNTVKGNMLVSVFGGGTSNSEFEFMTGNSMSYMPSGSVPYVQYVNEELPNLCKTLENQGYDSVAIHPYYPGGYRRDSVYKFFGFNSFVSIEDFDKPELVRNYISDRESYQKVIEQFENKEEGKPLFVLNVTMQNHGGFAIGDYEFEKEISVEGIDNVPKAEEYLSLIRESDRAFEELIQYFSKVEEPTIVVMFGDHQANIETEFYEYLYGKSLSELDINEIQKRYTTPFVIWANYDIEEGYIDAMSLNYLSSYVLKVAGVEMTDYNRYLLELFKSIPVQNSIGYMDNSGNYFSLEEEREEVNLLLKYHMLQYNYMFDKKNRVNNFFEVIN